MTDEQFYEMKKKYNRHLSSIITFDLVESIDQRIETFEEFCRIYSDEKKITKNNDDKALQ